LVIVISYVICVTNSLSYDWTLMLVTSLLLQLGNVTI